MREQVENSHPTNLRDDLDRFVAAIAEGESWHDDHVVDMLRQARTITTRSQLDALPVETVVRELSRDGFVLEKYWDQVWDEARWLYPGDDDPQLFPSLPAIVLWRPEGGDQ